MPWPSSNRLYYDKIPSGEITVRRAKQRSGPGRPTEDFDSMRPFYPPTYGAFPHPSYPKDVWQYSAPFLYQPYHYPEPSRAHSPDSTRQPGQGLPDLITPSSEIRRNKIPNHDLPIHRAMDSIHLNPSSRTSGNNAICPRPCLIPHPDEPRIPFVAAAQQLDSTVRRAITFFDSFYQDFRLHSDGHREHADKRLLDKLWRSKIRGSSSNPRRKYNDKSQQDDDNQNGNRNQNNGFQNRNNNFNNRNNNSNNNNNYQNSNGNNNDNDNNDNQVSTFPDEIFSFHELQRQVIHRIEQLIRSRRPILPFLSSSSSTTCSLNSNEDDEDEYFDEELHSQQQRAQAVQNLKEDIEHDYMGIKRAVEGMGRDHSQAKTAIRKLKIVKQYLCTYRVAWDDRYEDNGGWDSDDEEGGGRGRNGAK